MQPLFIATEPFGPWNDGKWQSYINWSGLTQLDQLVSLDTILCNPVLREIADDYWPHILNENFLLCYFTDLEFMLAQLQENADANILCVFRNPPSQPTAPKTSLPFSFVGYDLVETETGVSALTNCGGFPKAFSNDALNKFGLLDTHGEAVKVQAALVENYPDEEHANCEYWAVFIASGKPKKRS